MIGRPETEAEVVLLDRVHAKCGAAVGAAIRASIIEIACGPEPEEVQALIDRFVEQTGAAGLREALTADAAAREAFVRELSASFGLEDELVAALIASSRAGNCPNRRRPAPSRTRYASGWSRRCCCSKSARPQRRSARGRRSLQKRSSLATRRIQERLARETGEMLRPLANDLAPEQPPPLVAAARDAEAARERIAASDFVEGIRGYVAAADAARAADWPLMATGFELAIAGALTDVAGARRNSRRRSGRLESGEPNLARGSGQLQDQALDLGLAAADRLVDRGELAASDDLLARSAAVLARLEPLVSARGGPGRHVAMMSQLAMLRRAQAQRSGDFEQLRQAAAAADAAIAVAEELGEEEHVRRLTPWAIVQLELGRWTGTARTWTRRCAGSRRSQRRVDPDEDPIGWAWAENNVAVVLSDKASLGNDARMLREAADTYRRIAGRVDPEAEPDAWATYTRNLANSLVKLGGWEGSAGPVREAIGELEKLRAFEAEREAGLAAADTLSKLAHAWWQIGYLERDVAAHDKAAALMREAAEVYDPETAARFRVAAELQLGDILREAGELAADPGKLTAAAETYAAARVTAEASWATPALRRRDAAAGGRAAPGHNAGRCSEPCGGPSGAGGGGGGHRRGAVARRGHTRVGAARRGGRAPRRGAWGDAAR